MISIILPFYNTEKYLNNCLSSIKAQTFLDFECLLIDDGSTDNSRMIAQQYVDNDKRFKLINNIHIGYPACKNLGLDIAQGQYICFIDSDDYVEKFHLENLYNALIATDSDISNCTAFYIQDDSNNYSNEIYNNQFDVFSGTEKILDKYFRDTYPWNKLFKKELFNNLRYDNVEALSDTLLLHLVFEKANKTVYTNYKSYHYRIHNNSITYNVRNYSKTYWPYRVNVYIKVCSYISKYPGLKQRAKSIMDNQWYFCSLHLTNEQIIDFKNNKTLQELLKKE